LSFPERTPNEHLVDPHAWPIDGARAEDNANVKPNADFDQVLARQFVPERVGERFEHEGAIDDRLGFIAFTLFSLRCGGIEVVENMP
jgi:hypothetical protein